MCSIAAFAIVIRPRGEEDTACTSGLDDPRTLRVAAPLDGFLDFAGLEAARADVHATRRAAVVDPYALEIRIKAAIGGNHRVAAGVAEGGTLGAYVAYL